MRCLATSNPYHAESSAGSLLPAVSTFALRNATVAIVTVHINEPVSMQLWVPRHHHTGRARPIVPRPKALHRAGLLFVGIIVSNHCQLMHLLSATSKEHAATPARPSAIQMPGALMPRARNPSPCSALAGHARHRLCATLVCCLFRAIHIVIDRVIQPHRMMSRRPSFRDVRNAISMPSLTCHSLQKHSPATISASVLHKSGGTSEL